MRRRSLAALLLIGPVAAFSALVLSDRLLFGILQTIVASTSAYRLELREPSLTWSPFHFSAAILLITPDTQNSAPLFAVQALDVQGSVSDWIRGRDTGTLRASNLTVYIDETAPGGRPEASTLLEPLTLFPSRIDIDSIHLISRGDNVWIFPLVNLSAIRREDGAIAAIAAAAPSTTPLVIEALITPDTSFGNVQGLDLRAQVIGRDGEIALSVDGQVNAQKNNLSYDLALSGNYSRVDDFLMALDEDAITLEGELSLKGQLRGNLDELALQIDDLQVNNGDAYRFGATGTLSQTGGASPDIAMTLEGTLNDAQTLTVLPQSLRSRLGPSTLTLQVVGTLAAPIVESLQLNASTPDGIQLKALASDLRADTAALMDTLNSAPIRVQLSAADHQGLAALLGRQLPTFGPWSLAGTLMVEEDLYRLETIEVLLQLDSLSRIRGAGSVGRIRLSPDTSQLGFEGLEFTASIQMDSGHEWWSAQPALSTLPLYPQAIDMHLSGSVADVENLNGVDVSLSISQAVFGAAMDTIPPWLPLPLRATGSAQLLRAAETWRLQEVAWLSELADGTKLRIDGDGSFRSGLPEADLRVTLTAPESANLPQPGPVIVAAKSATAQLRLRERYATVLGEITTPNTPMQAVISADLDGAHLTHLSADLYTASLDLADISIPNESGVAEATENEPMDWSQLISRYPVRATLRIDDLHGDFTSIDSLVVDLDVDGSSHLLRQFDMRYATGSLELRGLFDFASDTPAVSLAGQGTRVPLAALGRDLGLQKEITGELSLRGGVAATGGNLEDLMNSLQGRVAVAVDDATVSGAAYDLLMSNLLAWLARGSSEKTTTFDCSMAQFDIKDGVANSDSLYIETPRMVATGKVRIDLPASTIDLRLEPRSRTRSLQFPSAVKMTGPLSNPKVGVSALQATADASAQALLLLPSLTLKLFGIGIDSKEPSRPCQAALQ